MSELMLMSNSFSPGRGALEHAFEAIADLLPGGGSALFIPYAGRDPDAYTDAMQAVLAPLGVRVTGAHRVADPLAALAGADLVFVGGGNTFRLVRTLERNGLLAAIRHRVAGGRPYLGVSAGANLACPTLRTTNDMPVTEPASFQALNLIPFQLNPHYPDEPSLAAARDERLRDFLYDNDVPVLGLCEGSWLRVCGDRAVLGGTQGARLLRRGTDPLDLHPGDDVSHLLATEPRYDVPA